MEGVSALQKVAANVPRYDDGFVRQFLCQEASMDCWFGKCNKCSGISAESLKSAVGNVSLQSPVSWIVWGKNAQSKRIEKHKKKGTLESLIAHIAALSPQFLKHSYIKREQSLTFNIHDIPRASNADYAVEALLQMDFAENFVCEAQDEVQSAHWNQRQLALFTSAFYHNDIFQSKVFVSDNLSHTKDVIVPYIYKLLSGMPSSVTILKLWTDGPSSQFKNKFIATIIPHFEKKFGMQIIWNYFATSHGKGCVDGIGATVKCVVRNQIKARHCIVNSAREFVEAFQHTQSQILVAEVAEEEFNKINTILDTATIFANAKNIRDISSSHQIRTIGDEIVAYTTSQQGYN